jgi:hypothetical protein
LHRSQGAAIASARAHVRQPKIDFKAFRTLCVIDEFARGSIAIRASRTLKSTDMIETLANGRSKPHRP